MKRVAQPTGSRRVGFTPSSTAQEPFDHGHITCHLSEPQLPCL